jgi:hypothetical protein
MTHRSLGFVLVSTDWVMMCPAFFTLKYERCGYLWWSMNSVYASFALFHRNFHTICIRKLQTIQLCSGSCHFLLHASLTVEMKAYNWARQPILGLGLLVEVDSRCRRMVSFTPRPPYPQVSPWHALYAKMDGPQRLFGRCLLSRHQKVRDCPPPAPL